MKNEIYCAATSRLNVGGTNQSGDREFSEALNRIYEKYGNNLSAFYQDVKKTILVEKSAESKPAKR